jgi:hypothetical protein
MGRLVRFLIDTLLVLLLLLLFSLIGAIVFPALFTVLNFGYSAHVNFGWLGTSWYAPLFTIFLIGAPITLTFLVG